MEWPSLQRLNFFSYLTIPAEIVRLFFQFNDLMFESILYIDWLNVYQTTMFFSDW